MLADRKKFIDKYITTSFKGKFEMSLSKVEQFKYNLKKFFPKDLNSKCLDIGVGRGEMLFLWQKLGYKNYEGIDVSTEVVEFCNKISGNNVITLVEDTVDYLKTRKGDYDLIALIDLIEHIPKDNILNFMNAVHEALSENGIVIIQTPNMNAIFPRIYRYNDITHEFGYQEHSLEQLMRFAGFSAFDFYSSMVPPRTMKGKIRVILQYSLYNLVKLIRRIDTSEMGFKVLTPNIICVVKK